MWKLPLFVTGGMAAGRNLRRGEAWRGLARQIEQDTRIRLDCYVIGSAGLRDAGRFGDVYGVGAPGAVLVRPDGHVAWRSFGAPSDQGTLRSVLLRVLARPND